MSRHQRLRGLRYHQTLRDLITAVCFVLLLRIPFLTQAVQGDDVNYLGAAQYAQINPAHPLHYEFVFLGHHVSMRGHPHPPLNAWVLAGLLAVWGEVREVPFHAAYLVFSLIAAVAGLSLARRFTSHPLLSTLLFLATPAFVINGNSLETDVPFLAFWLASIALFTRAVDAGSIRWLAGACAAMPLAAMAAYQSVLLVPILALYLWRQRRRWIPGWIVLAAVPATIGTWQLFEWWTSEKLPAQVLAGYFSSYGLQALENKLKNALALTTHAGWMVFPALIWAGFFERRFAPWVAVAAAAAFLDPNPLFWFCFASGVLVLVWSFTHRDDFLAAWLLLFFAAALILFYAGSARYLLPVAAPLAFLISNRLTGRKGLLMAGIGLQLALSLTLATVNYRHWEQYRSAVATFERDWTNRRVWVNGEFGLRFYAESAGAMPMLQGQGTRPGDLILSSQLSMPVNFATGGGVVTPVATVPVTTSIPLRLFAVGSKSAYSSASNGSRAFDIDTGPIDRIQLQQVTARKPGLSMLPMNAPEADFQIVSGIQGLEDNRFRWMGKRGVILLKRPAMAASIEVKLFIPESVPGREVTLALDGTEIARQRYLGAGTYTLETKPVLPAGEAGTLAIEVDKTVSVPGDQRQLGLILVSAGFR